jgi:hypothetical protein
MSKRQEFSSLPAPVVRLRAKVFLPIIDVNYVNFSFR